MDDGPKVAALVLNWNNYSDTEECIKSLQGLSYPYMDISVIDNGSSDGSGAAIDDEFPEVEVIYLQENLGFSGGFNKGIRKVLEEGADFIWLVSNDMRFSGRNTLTDLVSIIEKSKNVGILSPLVTKYPETDTIWFDQGSIDWKRGRGIHQNINQKTDEVGSNTGIQYNDYIAYCCPLIRRNVLNEIGLLSEEYFLYNEDIDHCTRAKANGIDLATAMSVQAHHKVNASTEGGTSPTVSYYMARNRWLFAKKFPENTNNLFLFYYIWSILLGTISRLLEKNINGGFAWVRGFLHGLLGKTGQGPYP